MHTSWLYLITRSTVSRFRRKGNINKISRKKSIPRQRQDSYGFDTKWKITWNTFNLKYMKLLPYKSNLKRFRINYLPPAIVSKFCTD